MQWNELPSQITLSSQPAIYLCEKTWRWERREFVDFDLWVVLGGKGEVIVNGAHHFVTRGTGFLFRPGDSVKAWHDPQKPLRVFAVHFEVSRSVTSWLVQAVSRFVELNDVIQFEVLAVELAQRALLNELEDGTGELQLANLLAEAGRTLSARSRDPVEEKLRALCGEIGADPAADWTTEILAGKTALSPSQFNRRFRAFTGTSPARYLIARRIDRARRLLIETPMTLQEIAAALGYSDIYYFHRQFRAETGITPGAMRQEASREKFAA